MFWLAVLTLAPLTQVAGQSSSPPDPFIGPQACRACHSAQTNEFFRNPHFKSQVAKGLEKAQVSCEGCHGPGRKHVQAGGGKASIMAFSEMTPKQALDRCLTCHSKDLSRGNIHRSSHTQADVACTSCHSIHKSETPKALLAKQQTQLCYSCHQDVKAQFSMPFKHRVNEGSVQCSDCHNPHGAPAATWRMSSRPRMMQHAQANEEPCLNCHADKRGPFQFEHAAVRVDGCESCHSPHGSTNARLLKRPLVFTLCLECHSGAGNFGRQGDGIKQTPSFHNMTDPRYQNCTACHVRIHGSNSDPRFLR